MHLIIPYAAFAGVPDGALQNLELPHLRQWLGQAQCIHRDEDTPDEKPSPHMPHERAWARSLGWPAMSPLPWAAWTHPTRNEPQAWITPCHWQIGMDQVVMLDPQQLSLGDEESQQLLQAMQPFLQEDRLQVQWDSALRWHAMGNIFQDLSSTSLDRVIGANVKPWITDGHLPASLRRLQSEMQMLLYNHPINDARMARGQLTVNSFWVHGAGQLAAPASTAPDNDVVLVDALRTPTLRGDLQAWQAAWRQIDAQQLAPLLGRANGLSLCSESAAHTYQQTPATWLQRVGAVFRKPDTAATLKALIPT